MKSNSRRVAIGFLLVAIFRGGASVAQPDASPQFSFGVVADVQYADRDNAGFLRHYREGLDRLADCASNLNARSTLFTIQLGDIIDGYPGDAERSRRDYLAVADVFGRISRTRRHVVGNHCLTVQRAWLLNRLGQSAFYYDFTEPAAPGWRFIVLDGNYQGYGTIGPEQLAWLRGRLEAADRAQERVILFCHFPLVQITARERQADPPAPLLGYLGRPSRVVACFAGHDHGGGYTLTNGIHAVTVRGMVDAPRTAYAVIEVYADRLREIGFGSEPSRDLPLSGRVRK